MIPFPHSDDLRWNQYFSTRIDETLFLSLFPWHSTNRDWFFLSSLYNFYDDWHEKIQISNGGQIILSAVDRESGQKAMYAKTNCPSSSLSIFNWNCRCSLFCFWGNRILSLGCAVQMAYLQMCSFRFIVSFLFDSKRVWSEKSWVWN